MLPAMRRDAPTWLLEPTLRFLALVPLALAASGLALEIAARGLSLASPVRPVWFSALATGVSHLVILALAARLVRAHGRGWAQSFGLLSANWPRRLLLAGALTLPALAGAWLAHQGAAFLLDAARIPHDHQAAVDAIRNSARGWERGLILVFAVITAPIAEETLFRGVLWPWMRDLGFPRAGFLGGSFLFALIHFNASAFLPLWLLGAFWTWLYQRTGDLAAPILSHSIFNLVNFAWIVWSVPAAVP